MKSYYIVFIATLLVYSCVKEDENVTTIKGIALNYSNNEPISEGTITITGIDEGAIYIHNVIGQRFSSTTTINNDGTFYLQLTTPKNEDYLILTVDIRGERVTTQCRPINCLELKPGMDYLDMILYVTLYVN